MNVLIFVMSLLMILALLTYGRLDMYRSFVVTQGEFERYMSEGERQVINKGAQQWYDWTTLTPKNGGKPKKQAPKDASPKLSVSWLFKSENQQDNPQLYQANREILKKLFFTVFENQIDFKNALNKNPNVVDELINAMEAEGRKLAAEKKPIKTTEGLENLDVENPMLQDLYYYVIKGYHFTKNKNVKSEMSDETSESEESNDQQQQEYVHKEGVVSLLDFLTMNPNKTKIRVFLAPRALLLAIFGDSQTVDEILHDRLEFYQQAKNEEDTSTLSEQFKQKFSSRVHNIPEALLDYTVTSSDPRSYEVP